MISRKQLLLYLVIQNPLIFNLIIVCKWEDWLITISLYIT